MSNMQQLIRSCMIKRSDNFFHAENSSFHQNRFKNYAFKHADEKFKLQEFNEQTDHIFQWLTNEVHQQLKNLKTQNVLLVLQLYISKLEWKTWLIFDHWHQHSNDYYWSDAHKHANWSCESKEQSIMNYNFLMFWLQDCKNFIVVTSSDFIMKQKKLRWSASYLSKKSCNQWQDHMMSICNHDEKLNWKYYIEYLHAKLSNSEIHNFQTEYWLEVVKQRVNQSIVNFKQYLIRLYANLNYYIFNKTCMMYLWMKINEIIMNESLHISYIFINYVNLLKHLINIDLHLQNINALLKLHLQQSESAAFQKSFQFLHEKTKFIIATENLKFSALSTQSKNDATLKFNEFKQSVASFNLMCWSCKKLKHKIDNSMCLNYAFRQKIHNHDKEMKKEKVWCSSSNH